MRKNTEQRRKIIETAGSVELAWRQPSEAMMQSLRLFPLLLLCLVLSACQSPGQNTYGAREVGKVALVQFGVIISQREVDVTAKNTGAGALGGALAGGGAVAASGGSRGAGAAAVVGGALVGALLEQALANRKATEFIITLEKGQTITLVQDNKEGDAPLNNGDRVMVQVMGKTQRVLPAAAMPTEVQRPKGIKVTN
jgi:outer membrane lipoprotein SlyB